MWTEYSQAPGIVQRYKPHNNPKGLALITTDDALDAKGPGSWALSSSHLWSLNNEFCRMILRLVLGAQVMTAIVSFGDAKQRSGL